MNTASNMKKYTIFTLALVAFAFFIGSSATPTATLAVGSSSKSVSPWHTCTTTATATACIVITSDNAGCSEAWNHNVATRTFSILTDFVSAVFFAVVLIIVFFPRLVDGLNNQLIARRAIVSSAVVTVVFALIYWATNVAFFTGKFCNSASSLKDSSYTLGPSVPLAIVGCALVVGAIIAEFFMADATQPEELAPKLVCGAAFNAIATPVSNEQLNPVVVATRKIIVRLVVDREALAEGHVKENWIKSAKAHIENLAKGVTVEIKSDKTHKDFLNVDAFSYGSTKPPQPSIVVFLVIPAKQDRDPFPEDCNMLQMGYLVQDRGDCDSIWIASAFSGGAVPIDTVDANRKTRCYDGPAAWSKIMRKILQ